MGQITQATIDMIEKHAIRGEMPPLTAWEVLQLAHAWKATRVSVEDPWQTLFCEVARVLNCLPSIFPDGNAHVLKKARALSAAPLPPNGEAATEVCNVCGGVVSLTARAATQPAGEEAP